MVRPPDASATSDAYLDARFGPSCPIELTVVSGIATLAIVSGSIAGALLWNADDTAFFRATDAADAWRPAIVWILMYCVTTAFVTAVAFPSWIVFGQADLLRRLRWRAVAAVVLVAAPLMAVSQIAPNAVGDNQNLHSWHIRGINLLSIVGISAAVFALVDIASRFARTHQRTAGEVRSARTTANRAVTLLAVLWTLAILTSQARQQAIAQLPGERSFPPGQLIVYGSVFAVTVAALFIPADHNINLKAAEIRKGGASSDESDVDQADLGLDRSTGDRLIRALTILSPLLAAIGSISIG